MIPTTTRPLPMETLPLDLPTLSVATATAMHGLPWCPHLESQITMIDSSHVFSITRVPLPLTTKTDKRAFTRKDLVEDLVQVKDCWGQRCSLCKFSFSTDDDDDVTSLVSTVAMTTELTILNVGGLCFLWRFIRYGIPGTFYCHFWLFVLILLNVCLFFRKK